MATRTHITNTLAVVLMAMGVVGISAGQANAGPITILNPGFEYGNNGQTPPPHNTTIVDDWNQEGAVYIDNNNSYKPASDAGPCLYLGGLNSAVNQDLTNTWAASDVYTLGVIGQNPTWNTGSSCTFKIELRQTNGIVLWSSGDLDVTDTVAGAVYTGTGHIISEIIYASAFAGGTPGEPLNIRFRASGNKAVYLDDITLALEDAAPPSVAGGICVGTISLTVTGHVGSIQWQESANGSTWSDVSGATDTNLNVSALYTNTPWFRVEAINGGNPPDYSTTMEVTSAGPPPPAGTMVTIR